MPLKIILIFDITVHSCIESGTNSQRITLIGELNTFSSRSVSSVVETCFHSCTHTGDAASSKLFCDES